jgi:hypothetical protein
MSNSQADIQAELLYDAHSRMSSVLGDTRAFVAAFIDAPPGEEASWQRPSLAEAAAYLGSDSVLDKLMCYSARDFGDDYVLTDFADDPALPTGQDDVDRSPQPIRLFMRFVELLAPWPEISEGDPAEASGGGSLVLRFYWRREHDGHLALRDLIDRVAEQGVAVDAGLVAALYGAIASMHQPRDVAAASARAYLAICGRLPAATFSDQGLPDSTGFAHTMLHWSADDLRRRDDDMPLAPEWLLPRHAWHRADALAQFARMLWRPGCVIDVIDAFFERNGPSHGRDGLIVMLRLVTEEELLFFRSRGADEYDALSDTLAEARNERAGPDEADRAVAVPLADIAMLGYIADAGLLGSRDWMVDIHDAAYGQFDLVWLQWLALAELDLEEQDESTGERMIRFGVDALTFLWPSRMLPVGDARRMLLRTPPEDMLLPDADALTSLVDDIEAEAAALAARADLSALPEDAEWHVALDLDDDVGLASLGVRQVRLIAGPDLAVRGVAFMADAEAQPQYGEPICSVVLADTSAGHRGNGEPIESVGGLSALSIILPAWARPLARLVAACARIDLARSTNALTSARRVRTDGWQLHARWRALAGSRTNSGLRRLAQLLGTAAR